MYIQCWGKKRHELFPTPISRSRGMTLNWIAKRLLNNGEHGSRWLPNSRNHFLEVPTYFVFALFTNAWRVNWRCASVFRSFSRSFFAPIVATTGACLCQMVFNLAARKMISRSRVISSHFTIYLEFSESPRTRERRKNASCDVEARRNEETSF